MDVDSNQITGLEITDDKSHDSKHFVYLTEQSKQFKNVAKTLADGIMIPNMISHICIIKK